MRTPYPWRSRPRARIVAVDDDQKLLYLVRDLLEEEGYEVHTLARWEDAFERVAELRPDVVLLDLKMGGDVEAGWRVLDLLTLRRETRPIPVIVCSGAIDSLREHAPALLPEHGVHVLTKPFDLDALLAAIHEALTSAPQEVRTASDAAEPDYNPLSARQAEVAVLIARGCTNAEIARELVVGEGTVANHVRHILDKLGLDNRAQVAVWAVERGLTHGKARLTPVARTGERSFHA